MRGRTKTPQPRQGEIVLMVVDNKGTGDRRRSSDRVHKPGERILMTSYLQMRTNTKAAAEQTSSSPVGGYYLWSDGKGGNESSQKHSPSSRTKMSSSRSFRKIGTQMFAESERKPSAHDQTNHEDSWLNQTGHTHEMMVKRKSSSRGGRSGRSKYTEQPLVSVTPRKSTSKRKQSKSKSAKKKPKGRYVYGMETSAEEFEDEYVPRRKKSSNKRLYVSKEKLIKTRGSRGGSRSQSLGFSPAVNTKKRSPPGVKYYGTDEKAEPGPHARPITTQDQNEPAQPMTKAQERQARLDSYYRRKLKYLEEKSEILNEVRRRQEKEDLRVMGTSIPTINERSKLLAKLHNQKKQLISDEKFLKRYFDHEKNRFETKLNRDYAYSPKPSKRPLPREWDFNDFEAVDPDQSGMAKDRSGKSKSKQKTQRQPTVNEYGEYIPDKSYKLTTSDFHERSLMFFNREQQYKAQTTKLRDQSLLNLDDDESYEVPKVRTRMKLLKEQEEKEALAMKSGKSPIQKNLERSPSSDHKEELRVSAKQSPMTSPAKRDPQTQTGFSATVRADTANRERFAAGKDLMTTEETRRQTDVRDIGINKENVAKKPAEDPPKHKYSLFGPEEMSPQQNTSPHTKIDLSFLDPVRRSMGGDDSDEAEGGIPISAIKRKVDPWLDVPPDRPRKSDFIRNEQVIEANRRQLYNRTGMGIAPETLFANGKPSRSVF